MPPRWLRMTISKILLLQTDTDTIAAKKEHVKVQELFADVQIRCKSLWGPESAQTLFDRICLPAQRLQNDKTLTGVFGVAAVTCPSPTPEAAQSQDCANRRPSQNGFLCSDVVQMHVLLERMPNCKTDMYTNCPFSRVSPFPCVIKLLLAFG